MLCSDFRRTCLRKTTYHIKILKECKTIVPVGVFGKNVNVKKLMEIDIHALWAGVVLSTSRDLLIIFQPLTDDCNINSFNNLTLDIVEVYGETF